MAKVRAYYGINSLYPSSVCKSALDEAGMSERPAKRRKPCQDETDHGKSKKKPSFSREIVRCEYQGCSFEGVRYSLPRHTKAMHPGQEPRPFGSVAAMLKVRLGEIVQMEAECRMRKAAAL